MTADNQNKKALKDVAAILLDEGKIIRIEASGFSMFPTIREGDIIHIEPVKEQEDICPGDIIAWKRENDIVVHRLVHKYVHDDENLFLTRGDSALSSDNPVSFESIAGKVVFIETKKGKKMVEGKPLIREWVYRVNNKRVWLVVRVRAVFRKIGIGEY